MFELFEMLLVVVVVVLLVMCVFDVGCGIGVVMFVIVRWFGVSV